MKNPLILLFSAILLISACSKKNAPTPDAKVVYIGDVSYSEVVIGSQTWTALNYNGPGGTIYNYPNNNLSANGKLYTHAEANAIVLPAGWRLPTQDDFNSLLAALGVSEPPKGSNTSNGAAGAPVLALMSTTGWTTPGGTNSSGFNAVAAGFYGNGYDGQASYQWHGLHAIFLSSSNYKGTPLSFDINQYPTYNMAYMTDFVLLTTDRGSIRFVKDN